MKLLSAKSAYLLFLVLVLLASCKPPTIEEQVEDLLKTNDYSRRISIANNLADSLNEHAVELLLGAGAQVSAQDGLKAMVSRYSLIMKETAKTDHACECLNIILSPVLSSGGFDNNKRLYLIVDELKRTEVEPSYHYCLEQIAIEHGDDGMMAVINAWKNDKNSPSMLSAIQEFGQPAVEYLVENLGQVKDYEELLGRIGDPALPFLIEKMKDDDQRIRFSAADALVKMSGYHPSALHQLTSAIDNESTSAIARNYPFYIRMGLADTEQLLLSALDRHFTEDMCTDYANCGNATIESGASDIAAKHGYYIFTTIGDHSGPKWGSGN